jgi:hypothetical protein
MHYGYSIRFLFSASNFSGAAFDYLVGRFLVVGANRYSVAAIHELPLQNNELSQILNCPRIGCPNRIGDNNNPMKMIRHDNHRAKVNLRVTGG